MKLLVGYDIDGVLANFVKGFLKRARQEGLAKGLPRSWTEWRGWLSGSNDSYNKVWEIIANDPEFWLNLEPLEGALEVQSSMVPDYYVTARPVPSAVSAQWLLKNGFPPAPVVTVPPGTNKVKEVTDLRLDYFVEDSVKNFKAINSQTDCYCFLIRTPHNLDDWSEDNILLHIRDLSSYTQTMEMIQSHYLEV